MEETQVVEVTESDNSWKIQALVIGGVIGALVGVGAAFLLTRNAERRGQELSITPGKGVRLGVLLAGLLRSIVSLGED